MKRIGVFCGASPGRKPEYPRAARRLGRALADRDIGLVFGGGKVGMMGEIAQAVLEKGGQVIGVIPRNLMIEEIAFTELSDLRVVDSMHERKALIAELSDGFVALPGGLGTLEEFFEALTWAQLGLHPKPCGLLNVQQYFSKLTHFLDHAANEQFIDMAHRSMILIDESAEGLLDQMEAYQPPQTDKVKWAVEMNGK